MTPRLLSSILAASIVLAPTALARRHAAETLSYKPIVIAGLFSLTGDGSSLGVASETALQLAVRDINRELAAISSPFRVEGTIEDTQLTGSIALQKIDAAYNLGARFVVGPQSSAEAGAMLAYANAHGMIVISQASTASSLAIPGDSLFRLAPNDKLEGAAQAALLKEQAIDAIVPMWRDDAGNRGLHDSTAAAFAKLGGSADAGVSYDPATEDFSARVMALGNAVRTLKSAHPSAHIAVYLASFEEAVDIMRLARLDSDLSTIRWFGGDGVAQSRALLDDPAVAAFAAATSFTAPNVGLDETARSTWEPLSDEIAARIGFRPDAYALSVYDATWVAALSALEVQNDPSLLHDSFVRNVQRYWGATGATALDENGDRKIGNFDFWTIRSASAATDWVRTAQFSGGNVSVTP